MVRFKKKIDITPYSKSSELEKIIGDIVYFYQINKGIPLFNWWRMYNLLRKPKH